MVDNGALVASDRGEVAVGTLGADLSKNPLKISIKMAVLILPIAKPIKSDFWLAFIDDMKSFIVSKIIKITSQ